MVYTDLLGKEPHRRVGIDSMGTSRNPGSVMVSTLARNARDVGIELTQYFPFSSHPQQH